jgi:hypothetical protein
MKRFFFLVILFCFCSFCFAENNDNDYLEQSRINRVEELKENLPPDVIKILRQLKFDLGRPCVPAITPENLFGIVFDLLKTKLLTPMRVITPCMGVVALCAIISNVAEFKNLKLNEILKVSGSCVCVGCVVLPIIKTVSAVLLALKTASNFILCLAPVLTGISVCAGKPVTAAAIGSSMIFAGNSVFLWLQNFLEPTIKVFLGIAISSSISKVINFKKLFDISYQVIKWLLIFASSIFALAVSLQKTVTVPIDNASCKGLKLAAGLTPIIGSCLGDAAETIRACSAVLGSSVGVFGIASVFFIFLPPIIECCTWMFSVSICEFLSGIFEIENITNLMGACRKVVNLMFAIIIFSFVIFLISSGILFFNLG